MNREILYRGKPVDKQFGKWVFGYYLQDLDNGKIKHYIFNCPLKIEIDPETVGQFTGIIDTNVDKIFEGDILNIYNSLIGRIVWCYSKSGFVLKSQNDYILNYLGAYDDDIKIIGNIYDTPSLLK